MSRTVIKVCGGWVGGGWWLRPILVFSLRLDQAEQYQNKTRGIIYVIESGPKMFQKKSQG